MPPTTLVLFHSANPPVDGAGGGGDHPVVQGAPVSSNLTWVTPAEAVASSTTWVLETVAPAEGTTTAVLGGWALATYVGSALKEVARPSAAMTTKTLDDRKAHLRSAAEPTAPRDGLAPPKLPCNGLLTGRSLVIGHCMGKRRSQRFVACVPTPANRLMSQTAASGRRAAVRHHGARRSGQEPRFRARRRRVVPSWWLIQSTSVPAYGDKIESPDGSQREVQGLFGLPLRTVWH